MGWALCLHRGSLKKKSRGLEAEEACRQSRDGHAGAGVEERRDQEPGDMAASRSWRRPGADSALEPAEEAQPCRLSDFSSVNPMSDSGLWNCKIIDICCFKPLSLY